MRILIVLLCVGLFCVMMSGCASFVWAPVIPPTAFVFTQYEAPLDVDFENTPITGKKGESSSICVLGIVAVGNASSRKAAENGNITHIQHADYSMLNVLGVFSKYTTIVYGD